MDMNTVGQGRQFAEATAAYDAAHGKAMDTIAAIPTETKLPTQQMPMAPQPTPFVLTTSMTGQR